MKKSIFMSLLAAVSLGMATVSCSSDNTEDEQGGSGSGKMETYTISCSFDNDTRMTLDADASPRKYKWETGDKITVFNASGTRLSAAKLSSGAGTNDGTFTFSATGTPAYMTFTSGGTGGSATANGKQITIDPTQTYASTGTAIADLPIMAQGELTKIGTNTYRGTLKHKMSFIKFGTITYNGNPTYLTISGTKAANIDPTTGNITAVATTAYTNSTIPAANVTSGKMIAVFPGFGFSVAALDETVMTNPTIEPNLIYTLNKEITVAPKTYPVEWQDGSGNLIRTDTKIWGTNITAPPAVSLANHVFEGWAISTTPETLAVEANASCNDATFGKATTYSDTKVVMVPCWHVYKMTTFLNAIIRTIIGEPYPSGEISNIVTTSANCKIVDDWTHVVVSSGTDVTNGTISTTDKSATFSIKSICTFATSATKWKGWQYYNASQNIDYMGTTNYTVSGKVSDWEGYSINATYKPD